MLRKFRTTIIIACYLLIILGCSSDENKLIGIWKPSDEMNETLYEDHVWEFKQDQLTIKDSDKVYKGSYEINSDKIIMKLVDATGDRKNGFGLYKLDGNKLTIKVNEKGEEYYPSNLNDENGYDLIYLMKSD
ncbi:hypothetical protein DNH61_24660 [Paenibacillus sambharensis]|uniref:Lipocalin-like domain-containing protein n=1 Tax=Paenibacillus sambharensis TaxID=1803190 RepID=A0A2W1LNX9_9BACL|nr:hypothetical protein [Paenibacillus sambharensis]PZD93127.1 hypothetical protein DNH61_24660 [Paenibacillus sambharensis]